MTTTADEEGPKKVKRVRKVAAPSSPEEEPEGHQDDPQDFDGDEADMYRFVTVPPIEEGILPSTAPPSIAEQVQELFNEFQADVAADEESFRQFMLWAAADDEVMFEDLLIATKSVYDIMGQDLPCTKATWAGLVDIANLVEVSSVAESELDYALEIFSKAYDLYKAELQRLDEERSEAEQASYDRITDEIMAEDNALFDQTTPEEAIAEEVSETEFTAELERWEKL
ncbi:MAG: hypothetical protein GWN18_18170, partial [Thermoplasmata archaeon]|nr:hypothetical protein [Thermoplasmata archaeon]NIS10456.1 hypothetical protein [Thermoplasmata archaeon]NIS21882.1 hypothetical protein [Thermoplasmata archaeon]NIT79487.1 hypothetical protein [Thermoplasmata archaeon]NIU50917.1 hypothetical protein [Thermoplasmata archaeon]